MNKKAFYLGSSSPRRKELLNRLGLSFQIIKPQNHEFFHHSLSPDELVLQLAQEKRIWLNKHVPEINGNWLLTADTLVHTQDSLLGKPKNKQDAREMLTTLSGIRHFVSTAFVLCSPEGILRSHTETTSVVFKKLNSSLIDYYLDTEEWHDAAGAYKIQSLGDILIKEIKGSFSNVMGLPIGPLYDIISAMDLI